jgi:hypothetical protein
MFPVCQLIHWSVIRSTALLPEQVEEHHRVAARRAYVSAIAHVREQRVPVRGGQCGSLGLPGQDERPRRGDRGGDLIAGTFTSAPFLQANRSRARRWEAIRWMLRQLCPSACMSTIWDTGGRLG